MKVAMIGLTHPHSAMYLETLAELDDVSHVALWDPDKEVCRTVAAQFPKADGIHTSLDALLARTDATHAVVAVRTDQCVEILVRLIGAGTSVFVEKPAARTTAEFAPVLAALTRTPVPFSIAYLNRWHPAIEQMRALYHDHAIGRLTSVELRMVTTQVRLRDPNHWLFQKEVAGGGILSWLGCHLIDLFRYVSGEEIVSVAAQLATTSAEHITVEDTAAVSFRTSGGAIGALHAGYLLAQGTAGYRGTSYDRAVVFRGTEGTMTYGFDGPLILESMAPRWGRASPRIFDFTLPTARGYGGTHGVDFVRAWLRAGPHDPTPAGPTDAVRVLEVLDAIYAANQERATIDVVHRPLPARPSGS